MLLGTSNTMLTVTCVTGAAAALLAHTACLVVHGCCVMARQRAGLQSGSRWQQRILLAR